MNPPFHLTIKDDTKVDTFFLLGAFEKYTYHVPRPDVFLVFRRMSASNEIAEQEKEQALRRQINIAMSRMHVLYEIQFIHTHAS